MYASSNRSANVAAGRAPDGIISRSCIDPYQQQQQQQQQQQLSRPPAYLASDVYSTQQSSQQLHLRLNGTPSSGQVDIRNLLLAPPSVRTKEGRGSVSAPATPVDDSVIGGCTGPSGIFSSSSPTASSPSSANNGTASNRTGLAKFIMLKKVNSSGAAGGSVSSAPGTSGSAVDGVLKDLIHPANGEALKSHSALTIKLLKTVSDFAQQLSAIEEQHGEQLQQLVEAYRKRNAELRKERPSGSYGLFQVWETLLQEVEVDSHVVADIANCLSRQVSRPLLDGTFYRKLEARKIFQHREQLESALEKASQQLDKSYQLYDEAYQQHLASPNTLTLAAYVELHNNYVQGVRAANAMADQYNNVILPQLIQELESVFVDLSKAMTSTIQHGCEAMSERTEGMSKRYTALANQCRNVNPSADLSTFVRSVTGTTGPNTALNVPSYFNKFAFIPPRNPAPTVSADMDPLLMLKDELVFDRLAGFSLRTKYESLKKDTADIEAHVRQLTDSLESLNRLQQRSLESNLYNKANELQEEICAKKLEWRMAQLHLAAIKAQRDLYGSKTETIIGETVGALQSSSSRSSKHLAASGNGSGGAGGGGQSGNGGSGIKSKWMKAIRTLTSSQGASSSSAGSSGASASTANNVNSLANDMEKGSRLYQAVMAVIALRKSPNTGSGKSERQRGAPMAAGGTAGSMHSASTIDLAYHLGEGQRHIFQENTYKKITPCDVCSQVLRGHARQGWKCRLCKINVHADCRNNVGRCLPKTRLLRRQKSSSELETTPSGQQQQQYTSAMLAMNNYELQSYSYQQGQQLVDGDDMLAGPEGDAPCGPSAGLVNRGEEIDQTYVVLKQASELAVATGSGSGRRPPGLPLVLPPNDQQSSPAPAEIIAGRPGVMRISTSGAVGQQQAPPSRRSNPNALSVGEPSSFLASSSAPHSPRRHQKLNLRMKSFSLDESGEHFHHHHHHGRCSGESVMRHHGSHPHVHQPHTGHQRLAHHRSSNPNTSVTAGSSGTLNNSQGSSYSQSPSSPVHHGRRALLSTKNTRMNSVELPDDNEKSQSSASASPCPSPKTQRLLPTNLYVVLFNFKGRETDELDLKAGYKVTVIDASDPDWWKGKCLGKIGFFPSKYVAKLAPNEKPLQVTHNLQLTDEADTDAGRLTKLLRDQIVIQIGEEQNGTVTVRSGDNKQGNCPIQYLQEV